MSLPKACAQRGLLHSGIGFAACLAQKLNAVLLNKLPNDKVIAMPIFIIISFKKQIALYKIIIY